VPGATPLVLDLDLHKGIERDEIEKEKDKIRFDQCERKKIEGTQK
jgi:hypothetical protein